jgi:hypothetical protein
MIDSHYLLRSSRDPAFVLALREASNQQRRVGPSGLLGQAPTRQD